MNKLQLLILLFVLLANSLMAQVGIGTNKPHDSSALEINSNSKGFLLPRLTSEQRDLINNGELALGLLIYNIDSRRLEIYDGVSWNSILMNKINDLIVNEELLNGDFESWENLTLNDWPNIDEGILVTPETSIVHLNNNSLAIKVQTTDQSDTDLRQLIHLQSGKYELSFYVYHLDGYSRVRIFAGKFRNYSDSTILNYWQKVSTEFTLDFDQEIEVGLRFYDVENFISESNLYIDNMQLIKVN